MGQRHIRIVEFRVRLPVAPPNLMPKKFYILPENIKNNKISLSGREAHHIANVLRRKIKDKIVFFDQKGKEYSSQISAISPRGLTAEIIEIKENQLIRNTEITLAQVMPKLDKFDLVLQKASELGVAEIIPLISQRCLINLDESKAKKKKERWEKIAKEAAEQCGRGSLPEIHAIKPLKSALELAKDYDLALFFCLDDQAKPLKEILKLNPSPKKIIIFIGPEGDFAPDEVELAKEKNLYLASLGKLVLRAETAPITILSILNYEYN